MRIVWTYRNQSNGWFSEALKFNDNLVIEGHGRYVVPL
jgi:hypothetical protein